MTRRSLTSQTQVSATLGYAGTVDDRRAGGNGAASAAAGAADGHDRPGDAADRAGDARRPTTQALAQARATLGGDRAKEAVDCAGDNAAQSAVGGRRRRRAAAPAPCATDAQAVATDEQSVDRRCGEGRGRPGPGLVGAERARAARRRASPPAQSSAATYGQSSTYTTLPAVGADRAPRAEPVRDRRRSRSLLLYGSVGAWRAFLPGMSPGADVAELNANLARSATRTASPATRSRRRPRRRSTRSGRARPDRRPAQLLLGSVVFEPGPVRVTRVTPTRRRDRAAGAGARRSPRPRGRSTIELDAAQQAEVKVGDPVTITLPDNSTTPGRVSLRRHGRDDPRARTRTAAAELADDRGRRHPDRPGRDRHLDQAPVNVSITTAQRQQRARRPGRTRCSRSRAAATRSRRSAPAARTTWSRSSSGCSTTPTASSR